MIPALALAGQPNSPSLQLDKVPLLRGVLLTRTDGASAYGSIPRVTTQFVSFVSQQSGQCEDIAVSEIASVKVEGPKPSDKFTPGETALMVPIAIPFFAASAVTRGFKSIFGKNDASLIDGRWQSEPASDGTITQMEITPSGVTKTFLLERDGTYQLKASELTISYSPDKDGSKHEYVIPFHFECGNLVTGLNTPTSPRTIFQLRSRNDAIDDPIVGRWHTHN